METQRRDFSVHEFLVQGAYVAADRGPSTTKRDRQRQSQSQRGARLRPTHFSSEDALAAQIGGRRYRRWVNDRLLRELAGPLDATEMASLFVPPPWGEPPAPSPLEQLLDQPGGAEQLLRTDMDRSSALMRTAAAVSSGSAKPSVDALSRGAIQAVRKDFDRPLVTALIAELDDFSRSCDAQLVLDLADPYHRLLAHGVCRLHGVLSESVTLASGQRVVIARRREDVDGGEGCREDDDRTVQLQQDKPAAAAVTVEVV